MEPSLVNLFALTWNNYIVTLELHFYYPLVINTDWKGRISDSHSKNTTSHSKYKEQD